MIYRSILGMAVLGLMIAGCSNPPAPAAKLDSGIGATGSAGMTGGAAAPPAGAGAVRTTVP